MSGLIVFEGIDGVGKTTQSRIFFNKLIQKGFLAKLLVEPSSGKYGQLIRKILRKEIEMDPENGDLYDLFLKDRTEHVNSEIIPYLKQGYYVVLDRYYLSTFAYQGNSRKLEDMIKDHDPFPVPDLTFIIDLDEKEAMKRLKSKNRGLDLFEEEKTLKEVRERFKLLLLKEKFARQSILLDGMQSLDKISSEIFFYFESKMIGSIK